MFKSKTVFECPFCEVSYDSEENVLNCLHRHDLVFNIEKLEEDNDCWGVCTADWKETELYFKEYKDADEYVQNNSNTRIRYIELIKGSCNR